jgi:flagellar biosynthesis protein FlhF
MNIRRYLASDMKSAFKAAREVHGDDVVILSSRRVKDQIEVTVAADQATAELARANALAVKQAKPAATVVKNPASDARVEALDDELRALRRLLETQLAALAWNDLTRRSPAITELSREWMQLGFDRDLLGRILGALPVTDQLSTVRTLAREQLVSRLSVTGDRWIEEGARVAFVGPAGSGKTTALTAVAARWVMRNGARNAVLVSCAESRLGAVEQLQRLGRLLGTPVVIASDLAALRSTLDRLSHYKLVLVDTAGRNPRQTDFASHCSGLAACAHELEYAITLPATLQSAALTETITAFQGLGASVGIATHLDEATALGGLVCSLIESQLPLAYTLSGSRLLDDLRPAVADAIIANATRTAEADSFDSKTTEGIRDVA